MLALAGSRHLPARAALLNTRRQPVLLPPLRNLGCSPVPAGPRGGRGAKSAHPLRRLLLTLLSPARSWAGVSLSADQGTVAGGVSEAHRDVAEPTSHLRGVLDPRWPARTPSVLRHRAGTCSSRRRRSVACASGSWSTLGILALGQGPRGARALTSPSPAGPCWLGPALGFRPP